MRNKPQSQLLWDMLNGPKVLYSDNSNNKGFTFTHSHTQSDPQIHIHIYWHTRVHTYRRIHMYLLRTFIFGRSQARDKSSFCVWVCVWVCVCVCVCASLISRMSQKRTYGGQSSERVDTDVDMWVSLVSVPDCSTVEASSIETLAGLGVYSL